MKYNKKMSDEEIKKRLLFVLENLIDVCNKNNLQYYVYGGTLIGTIRHQGFIPWDDDIDICMPRPSYDKLYKALESNPHITCFCCDYNKGYTHTYIKVADKSTVIRMPNSKDDEIMGVNIDVFPMDALGNTINDARKRMNSFDFKRSIAIMANLSSYMKGRSNSANVKIARFFFFLISRTILSNRLHIQINRDARKLVYTSYKYVGSLVDATYREKEIFQKDWFGDGVNAVFETLNVKIPAKSHELLTHMYGDYMTLPPKEKQVRIHDYSAFYK